MYLLYHVIEKNVSLNKYTSFPKNFTKKLEVKSSYPKEKRRIHKVLCYDNVLTAVCLSETKKTMQNIVQSKKLN